MQVPMKASWGHEAPVERRVPPKRLSSLHGAWLQGQAALAASCQDPGYTARNQVSVVASFPPLRTPSRLTSRQGRCTQGASCLCCDLRGDISVRTEQPAKEPTAVPPPLGDPSLERERGLAFSRPASRGLVWGWTRELQVTGRSSKGHAVIHRQPRE